MYFSLSFSFQGKMVLEEFNIEKVAGGSEKAVKMSFNASVTDHTLKIQFYWAGRGTQCIPDRGVYGPLISAISVTPSMPEKTFSLNFFMFTRKKFLKGNF